MNDRPVIDQVLEKDILLSYPFENIKSFLRMLREAASDPKVVSIKMTLYRLASHSKVVEALVEAAENGKQVDVLVELKARFDEENNIAWSRYLEEAGCHVIYGLDGLKVHSKLCLITRKTEGGIEYITQIGTGNYIEASQAGVKIEMVIRGICCLQSGLAGLTDNIRIISIVGRYLEHSRIYIFGTGERERIYIASADFMTRNTVRRVEVAAPVYDERLKLRIKEMLGFMLSDNVKAREQQPDGTYKKVQTGDTPLNSQELFFRMAYEAARKETE